MKLKVLFLDDDEIQHIIFEECLRYIGVSLDVKYFDDGNKALEYLKNLENRDIPNILFVDLHMPLMSGWEFFEGLVLIFENKKVNTTAYMLTSSLSEEDRIKAQNFSIIKEFIEKPLDIDKFKEIVEASKKELE